MTKRELINQLEALNVPDDTDVNIYDHMKNMGDDDGSGSSIGMYSEYTVGLMNDDLTQEEIDNFEIEHGIIPGVFIVLVFDNPELEED